MIAVETVVRKLVSDFEFVIIPGFGALLSHHVPASYDAETGVFAPSIKKLAFNEFLKLDDGLLANYISREEKISHLEAVAYIKQYTDTLRLALKNGEQAKIEGIGVFVNNIEGKLVFEPNTGNYFKDEWYGFKKVPVKSLEQKSRQATASFNGSSETHVVELIPNKPQDVNWKKLTLAAVLAGLMFFVSFFFVNSGANYNKSSLNPFGSFFEKPEKERPREVKGVLPARKEVTIPEVKTELPTIKTEKAIKTNTVKYKPVTNASKFSVIAGTFNGEKQANILLEELQEKGFNEAFIIPSNEFSKKVKVAVRQFDNKAEAYKFSASLTPVIGEAGWVYGEI